MTHTKMPTELNKSLKFGGAALLLGSIILSPELRQTLWNISVRAWAYCKRAGRKINLWIYTTFSGNERRPGSGFFY
jgi:hypothetical protein